MGALAMAVPGMAGMTGATLWATEDLSVNGQDITDLDVRLQPGLTMSGTIGGGSLRSMIRHNSIGRTDPPRSPEVVRLR